MRLPIYSLETLTGFLSRSQSGSMFPEPDTELELEDLPDPVQGELYGIYLEQSLQNPSLVKGTLLVFSRNEVRSPGGEALHCVGLVNGQVLIARLLRNDTDSPEDRKTQPDSVRPVRRKSFMTPTPLHIPTSRVSPIPGYTHESLLLGFENPDHTQSVEVVPVKNVVWLHPMVHKREPGPYGNEMKTGDVT